MGYDKYGRYVPDGKYEYIDLEQILKRQFNISFAHKKYAKKDFERLLPYLLPICKDYLRIKCEIKFIETTERKGILVDKTITREDIEKFLQKSEFDKEFVKTILKYINSKGKKLEDYDLTEEAIIALKSAGYKVPTKIYENPDKLLEKLEEICFGKQYLMREIIKKLSLVDILEEENTSDNEWKFTKASIIQKGDPNGSKTIKDPDTGVVLGLSVRGKVQADENGNAYVPTLFVMDTEGNLYSEDEFKANQRELEEKIMPFYYGKKGSLVKKIMNRREYVVLKIIFLYGLLTMSTIIAYSEYIATRDPFLITIMRGIVALTVLGSVIDMPIIKRMGKNIKAEVEEVKSITSIPIINTLHIARMIEEKIESGEIEANNTTAIAQIITPEVGRMLISGQAFENLLPSPQESASNEEDTFNHSDIVVTREKLESLRAKIDKTKPHTEDSTIPGLSEEEIKGIIETLKSIKTKIEQGTIYEGNMETPGTNKQLRKNYHSKKN
ncbi:MAG: hypothetical protein IKD77_04890 [Bacilli bacterium]|nr:hypothetical protein [Bacilli bacterium]